MVEGISEVNFEDWTRLDLRVAEIKEAEEIEGADKLYKLTLDVGEVGERIVCAGIKEYYSKDELVGKKIIYFSNLKPRVMRGIESQGMLLAASTENHSAPKSVPREVLKKTSTRGKVVLITPEKDIDDGVRIG